ncbi:MAG: hypothetical protein HC831_17210 [Chloroflexia bacterium]|nr:hypothetical protein [Chloroflexia bacterium]
MNVKKKTYRIILEKTRLESDNKKYKLFKVFDNKKLIYDATRENPFLK